MRDSDSSDLVMRSTLSNHEQQLRTLRQRRSSLLRITSFSAAVVGLLLSFTGLVIRTQLSITPQMLLFSIIPLMLAILLSVFKYKFYTIHWGYEPNQDSLTRFDSMSKEATVEELAEVYSHAATANKNEIRSVETWLFWIILLIFISLGAFTGIMIISF